VAAVSATARAAEGPASPPAWRAWLAAARPRTLPAALAPIAVGTATAAREGAFDAVVAVLCLATALLLQLAANLANDVFDFERGADGDGRLGPPRATQQGWIAPAAMRRATALALAAAAASGLALVARGGWPLGLAGAASVAAALAYTGGPWPLGYRGLGDLLVFVFFGLVGVVGSHFAHALTAPPVAWAAAVPVGALATAILVVNNLRDLEGDARVGKRTLAVRLGARATRVYYAGLLAAAPLAVGAAVAAGVLPPGALVALACVPALVRLARELARTEGAALNPLLARTARISAGFGLLLAAGIAA
jgi:1,4-dihydroxy-2-naphthoate octaprenyltransferase